MKSNGVCGLEGRRKFFDSEIRSLGQRPRRRASQMSRAAVTSSSELLRQTCRRSDGAVVWLQTAERVAHERGHIRLGDLQMINLNVS